MGWFVDHREAAIRCTAGIQPTLPPKRECRVDRRIHLGQAAQGGRDVRQEDGGVVVALVERHPGERGGVSAFAHCTSSVVLPYPAGATTVARRAVRSARSRSTSAGRGTIPGRRRGGASFDSRIGNAGPAGEGRIWTKE